MAKNVLVVAIDGWSSHSIGPYGNTMIETVALNRLAAQGLLFDNAVIDSPSLDSLYRSYWTGRHALCWPNPSESGPVETDSWVKAATEHGQRTVLLTDSPTVADHPLAASFREHEVVSIELPEHSAPSIDQTYLARFFERVMTSLQQTGSRGREGEPDSLPRSNESDEGNPGQLIWCHCSGMTAPWDAPYELRLAHVDEDDPDPPRFVQPPESGSDQDLDPDQRFGLQVAYAAQIEVLDACLGALMESLGSLAASTTLVVLGVRGYPLGEHRVVGLEQPVLHGELLSVPLIVRLPKSSGVSSDVPVRSPALIQPHEVGQAVGASLLEINTLKQVLSRGETPDRGDADGQEPVSFVREAALADQHYRLGWNATDDPAPLETGQAAQTTAEVARTPASADSLTIPPIAVAVSAEQQAIRTPAWFARFTGEHAELYAKPDDRFEVNEVAARGVDELDRMRTALQQFREQAEAGELAPSPNLPASLLRLHD